MIFSLVVSLPTLYIFQLSKVLPGLFLILNYEKTVIAHITCGSVFHFCPASGGNTDTPDMRHVFCLEIFVSPTQCAGSLHRRLYLGRKGSRPDSWLCWTLYLGLEKLIAEQQQPLHGSLWECPVPACAVGCWVMGQRQPRNLSGAAT